MHSDYRSKIFILSPASTTGRKAAMLGPGSRSDLARRLGAEGATVAEVFVFLSSLYFRGKFEYANAFGTPGNVYVITSSDGVVPASRLVRYTDIERFSAVKIESGNPLYFRPLKESALALSAAIGENGSAILLGSISTGKYSEMLLRVFRERLLFPTAFLGAGDMRRGGILLGAVRSGVELEYARAAEYGLVRRRLVRIDAEA